ncbi:MAG: NAD(P)-dependent oxidoreductase [Spirochaeta sp.]
MDKVNIAWIGTGIMGAPMCAHLIAAGMQVVVHNRTREKAEPLLDLGARWADTPAEAVQGVAVVFTMLGYPDDVERIYFGTPEMPGILDTVARTTVCIDMTTSSPELAERIAAYGSAKEIFCLDAPVSGGETGAQNAQLAIMVGGNHSTFAQVRSLLRWLGPDPQRMGPAGCGQHAKMANQILIASTMLGVVEALEYARSKRLPLELLVPLLGQGAAGSWSWNNLAPKISSGDYAPGFYTHHFLKDLKIALDEASRSGLSLPGLTQAAQLYERAVQLGFGNSGTQALAKVYTTVN